MDTLAEPLREQPAQYPRESLSLDQTRSDSVSHAAESTGLPATVAPPTAATAMMDEEGCLCCEWASTLSASATRPSFVPRESVVLPSRLRVVLSFLGIMPMPEQRNSALWFLYSKTIVFVLVGFRAYVWVLELEHWKRFHVLTNLLIAAALCRLILEAKMLLHSREQWRRLLTVQDALVIASVAAQSRMLRAMACFFLMLVFVVYPSFAVAGYVVLGDPITSTLSALAHVSKLCVVTPPAVLFVIRAKLCADEISRFLDGLEVAPPARTTGSLSNSAPTASLRIGAGATTQRRPSAACTVLDGYMQCWSLCKELSNEWGVYVACYITLFLVIGLMEALVRANVMFMVQTFILDFALAFCYLIRASLLSSAGETMAGSMSRTLCQQNDLDRGWLSDVLAVCTASPCGFSVGPVYISTTVLWGDFALFLLTVVARLVSE